MPLFKRKKEESQCACQCGGAKSNEAISTVCCGQEVDGICCIKVLGAGCSACHLMYENAKEAVKNSGINIEVEYITDMQEIAKYGVMSMPALVINEKIVSMGKVLKTAEIATLLKK